MGGFERLCHEQVCRDEFRGEWGDKGFASYQKGPDVALSQWRLFINALDRLRDERKMSILLLGHAKVDSFKNPEGDDFDTWIPDCHKKTWAVTHKWADLVLFCNHVVVVDKKGKGQSSQERVMYTEFHAAYSAKNRHGLPSEIDMGGTGAEAWQNFSSAMKAGRATKGGE
jgi:hypothetical protein